jgi:predicted nucleic acid-binding protein
MRYLLDSNAVRAYTRPSLTFLTNLKRATGAELSIPIVVWIEQVRGRQDALIKAPPDRVLTEQANLLATNRLLENFSVAYFDNRAVQTLGQLLRLHKTNKRYADVMIAALTLAERSILITRNTKDFADLLPAAQLQNWIDHVY